MPRPLQRVRLESGFKLDLNRLARRGFIKPGAFTGPVGIAWTEKYTGDEIASGLITADMSSIHGWFRIQLGHLDQRIMLTTKRRHFGGRQWHFVCPYTNRPASVLWKPPGAQSFASRLGSRRSLTPRNLWTASPGAIRARRRSNRGFAQLVASTLTNGICRQNRNG